MRPTNADSRAFKTQPRWAGELRELFVDGDDQPVLGDADHDDVGRPMTAVIPSRFRGGCELVARLRAHAGRHETIIGAAATSRLAHTRDIEEACMADPTRYPDTGEQTGVGPDHEPTTGRPRWQKVVGIVGLVVVVLLVLQATGVIGGSLGDRTPGPPAGGHG